MAPRFSQPTELTGTLADAASRHSVQLFIHLDRFSGSSSNKVTGAAKLFDGADRRRTTIFEARGSRSKEQMTAARGSAYISICFFLL